MWPPKLHLFRAQSLWAPPVLNIYTCMAVELIIVTMFHIGRSMIESSPPFSIEYKACFFSEYKFSKTKCTISRFQNSWIYPGPVFAEYIPSQNSKQKSPCFQKFGELCFWKKCMPGQSEILIVEIKRERERENL